MKLFDAGLNSLKSSNDASIIITTGFKILRQIEKYAALTLLLPEIQICIFVKNIFAAFKAEFSQKFSVM